MIPDGVDWYAHTQPWVSFCAMSTCDGLSKTLPPSPTMPPTKQVRCSLSVRREEELGCTRYFPERRMSELSGTRGRKKRFCIAVSIEYLYIRSYCAAGPVAPSSMYILRR